MWTTKVQTTSYALVHPILLLIITMIILATSWETLFMQYANNKGADQPAHPRSLISAFIFAA